MGTPDLIAAWSEVWVAQTWDWRLEWGWSCDLSPELRGLGLLQGSQCLNRTEFSNTQLGSRKLESWLLVEEKPTLGVRSVVSKHSSSKAASYDFCTCHGS